ncbi:A-kinase anchor protein 6 [Cricetulus griseus]|uniref:A-kinase anchor protein 6 n=1 Tax=Cricetulus griseus TaxID=10029 RepID=G3IKK3_CRIGR|nr:A-kinase anchor protein 6 [Cricetulus griseus]
MEQVGSSAVEEGLVNKLDEFIQWLHEAMETTENWTPPKAETDSLRLYLETHLVGNLVSCIAVSVKDFNSFKLNVDSHCALKEAVEEEGHQLLELIASHKAEGLKDMLKMIASQWKELQRQIKRQHSWILRALDTIKAEILATDVSVEDEEGTGSPKIILVLVVHKRLNDNSPLSHAQDGNGVNEFGDGGSLEILHFKQMFSYSLLSMNTLE